LDKGTNKDNLIRKESKLKPIKKSISYGRHTLTLETGEIARQAHGAVIVSMDDTVVLVTVVGAKSVRPGQDFFPLTVDYMERSYAAGRIPGSFFKREGRPSEKEILTSRLIDRPIRPLFPDSFYNEVQVVATVLSSDNEVDADIPAMIGASAALVLSGIPFDGPIAGARVGYINGDYVLNPTATELIETELNMVVAGTEHAGLMVESEAKELAEGVMLGAVEFGRKEMKAVINVINELADEAGVTVWDWAPAEQDASLTDRITQLAEADLRAAFDLKQKQARTEAIDKVWEKVNTEMGVGSEDGPDGQAVKKVCFDLESKIVRTRILNGEPRIDGRDTRTVRTISIRNGVLPRTPGSALFTRGENHALVISTLGTGCDVHRIAFLKWH